MTPSFAAAPAAAVENAVRRAFVESLGIAAVALDDDFFELGGDSLRAAKVLEHLFATLHVRLPPDIFFTCPTPRALAAAIETHRAGRTADDGASVVPLSTGGAGLPVFCFHGVTPRPWMSRSLVPALQLDRPVYATRAPDLTWDRDVMTIEEMALHYAIEIKRLQPRGPYAFLGYSFGGILAFATAARLVRDGHAVDHLVLLDTSAPGLSWRQLRARRRYAINDAIRALHHVGLITDSLVPRLGRETSLGNLRSPLGRARFAFGTGPLTTHELRNVLSFAFPSYGARRTRDMSFDELCSVIADELERTLTEKEWTRLVRRAGSEAPASLIKSQKLVAKNIRLAQRYKPRSIYSGRITIYAYEGNDDVVRWQQFTSHRLDVRRVAIAPRRGRDRHREFVAAHNIALYAADLRNVLASASG